MLISSLLLASLVSLSTAAVTGSGNHHAVKMQVFKRDDIPTPHDLELAEMHQVNLTEMYKHAVIKRGEDGDDEDIHIWVHNSFIQAEGPHLEVESVAKSQEHDKRQTQRVRIGDSFVNGGNPSLCNWHRNFVGRTSSSSPFTGGINAIARWGYATNGQFLALDDEWRNLVVGGSNSGLNARFTARNGDNIADWTWMGTHDIAWLSHEIVYRYRRTYSGRERAAGTGSSSCRATFWENPFPGSVRWGWQVYSSTTQT